MNKNVEQDIKEFLKNNYKSSRYHGRGAEYAAALLASSLSDFAEYGYVLISRHDSNSGAVVTFPNNRPIT